VAEEFSPFDDDTFVNEVPYISSPVMQIGYPEDKTFLEYEQEKESKDVSALRNLLLNLMEWAEDPVKNDDLLAKVIDMKSMARWYLSQEITREGDGYLVSQKWKFVKGKLYVASLWDYAGNSFMMTCDTDKVPGNTKYIDFETNAIDTFPCNASTGYFYSTGWHVDSLWDGRACDFVEDGCDSIKPGTALNDTNVWDMRHFFRHLFRAPSLQKEFWLLFDLVAEHGLVDDADRKSSTSESDIFKFGDLIEMYFQKVRSAAEVDLKIWSIPNVLFQLSYSEEFPVVDVEQCKPLLYEYLRASGTDDGTGNVTSIPGKEWSFVQAERNSKFFDFFKAEAKAVPSSARTIGAWNWPAYTSEEAVTSAKNFIKARLDWIASQKKSYLYSYNTLRGVNDENAQENAGYVK